MRDIDDALASLNWLRGFVEGLSFRPDATFKADPSEYFEDLENFIILSEENLESKEVKDE